MAGARKRRSDSINNVGERRNNRNGKSTKQQLIRQYKLMDQSDSDISELCQRCALIDFEAIYKIPAGSISSEGLPVFDLGHVSRAQPSQSCQFCQVLLQVLDDNRLSRTEEQGQSYVRCYLRAFSCLSVLGLARTKPRLALSPSIVIAVVPGDFYEDISIFRRDASLAAGVILPTTHGNDVVPTDRTLTYIGRRIHNDKIDFSIMRDWIKECCETHPVCLPENETTSASDASKSTVSKSLLVIDCHTRVLIELPQNASYVCLSYVWGSSVKNKPATVVKVGEQLPYPQARTVEDIIYVVKQLGEKYLWLDRYSIDQTDDEIRRQAILRMADIFERSILTIVALADNVDTGLWGVSAAHRTRQPTATIRSLQLVSSGPVLEDVLHKSMWSKRGWTLQEALLSRRMLFFSEDQVYWRCDAISYCESVQQSSAVESSRKKITRHFDPDIFSDANQYRKRFGETTLPLFARQIAEYTKRELTYDSDALVAFYAILSRAKEVNIFGIPIFLTQASLEADPCYSDEGFALGLLWSRSAHLWYKPWREFAKPPNISTGPRAYFPSWSWTSTSHSVQFDPISFDRGLSNKYGQLFACTYRHSPYVVKYADIEMPENIDATQPETLNITGMIVPWTIAQEETTDQPLTLKAKLQLPPSLSFPDAWYETGLAFLDHDVDIARAKQPGFVGQALLLVGYRRYGYNLRHVIWWMAIQAAEADCHRIGLIRSVYEIKEPTFSWRGNASHADHEHIRPFLPAKISNSLAGAHPLEDEVRQHLTKIQLA